MMYGKKNNVTFKLGYNDMQIFEFLILDAQMRRLYA